METQVQNTDDIYNPLDSWGVWGSVWLLLLDKQFAHHLHPNLAFADVLKINPFVQTYFRKTYIPMHQAYYNMIKSAKFTWER